MERINSALEKLGLSEKEVNVYLSCLELGEATANDIALKSHVPRTLVYDIFKRLIGKGLASVIIKEKTKYFGVVNPEELLRMLKEKEEILLSVLENLKKIQKNRVEIPKVEVFLGVEGVKSILEDVLRTKPPEVCIYGTSATSFDIMPAHIYHWHLKRAKLRIKTKTIYNDVEKAKRRIKKYPDTLKYLEYRFLPIKYESPTAFIIYNNRLVMIYWSKEPLTILIENKEIVATHKQYFYQLWKVAK